MPTARKNHSKIRTLLRRFTNRTASNLNRHKSVHSTPALNNSPLTQWSLSPESSPTTTTWNHRTSPSSSGTHHFQTRPPRGTVGWTDMITPQADTTTSRASGGDTAKRLLADTPLTQPTDPQEADSQVEPNPSGNLSTMSRDDLIQRMLSAFHKGDGSFGMEDVEAWLKAHSIRRSRERRPAPVKHSRVQLVPPSRQDMNLWEQGRYSNVDPAEDEPAETTLWAALENSRRVVEEERAKFKMLFEMPRSYRRSSGGRLAAAEVLASVQEERQLGWAEQAEFEATRMAVKESLEFPATAGRSSSFRCPSSACGAGGDCVEEARRFSRLLRLHRHRPARGGRKNGKPSKRCSHECVGRSASCPNLPMGSVDAQQQEVMDTSSKVPEASPSSLIDTPLGQNGHVPKLTLSLPPRSNPFDFRQLGYKYVSFLAEGSLGTLHLVQLDETASTGAPSSSGGDSEVSNGDRRLWVAKVVDLGVFPTSAEASQALLEAELLRRLEHSNIVAYRSSFITDTHLIIVMEFCENGDLHSFLNRLRESGEYLPEELVFKWTKDIAQGLNYMHLQNVLHCDVKSSNVFLDANMNAKIGDLGIARELRRGASALSPTRCPRGTPVYMSPEMCRRAALTERSDCWSLGCILFELCHLKHAFSSQLEIGGDTLNKRDRENGSVISCASHNSSGSSVSGFSAAFLPGVTGRSDMSYLCKEMLSNIKTDLRKLRHKARKNETIEISERQQDFEPLAFWTESAKDQTFLLPQVLPEQYSPLLNYLVCAMLEPRPLDRPSLTQIIRVISEVPIPIDSGVEAQDEPINEEGQCIEMSEEQESGCGPPYAYVFPSTVLPQQNSEGITSMSVVPDESPSQKRHLCGVPCPDGTRCPAYSRTPQSLRAAPDDSTANACRLLRTR